MEPADPLAQLQDFAARVEALLERNQRLAEENRSLRHQQEQLVAERSTLLAKNEQARSRVEAMIEAGSNPWSSTHERRTGQCPHPRS